MMSNSEEARSLKQENELLHQETHKLTLRLETLTKQHLSEVEFIREEHEHEKKDLKSSIGKLHDEYKARESLKEEKNQALTDELTCLREELEACQSQNEKYRSQVEILKSAKSAGAASSYSDYEGLKESQRTLRAQLAEKDEILTAQTEKIARLDREVGLLRGMVTELSEVGEGKDSVIRDLGGRIKELEREKEEESGALQNEVLLLKDELKRLSGAAAAGGGDDGRAGGGSRGNSLFSEVEERRIKVEGELTRLRDLVKRLTTENRTLQLELERGDTHSASITTQLEVISKSEHELAVEIKRDKSETLNLFDSYRDRFEYLRNEYTRKLQQYKSSTATPSPSACELETLRQDRDSLQLLKISMERENNDLKRELKFNKHLRTNAESNVKMLKAQVEFFKNASSSGGAGGGDVETTSKRTSENENNENNSGDESGGGGGVVFPTPKRSLITKHDEGKSECSQQ